LLGSVVTVGGKESDKGTVLSYSGEIDEVLQRREASELKS